MGLCPCGASQGKRKIRLRAGRVAALAPGPGQLCRSRNRCEPRDAGRFGAGLFHPTAFCAIARSRRIGAPRMVRIEAWDAPTPAHRLDPLLKRYCVLARIIREAFSPIMIDGALVFPDVSVGMTDASATRRPCMPCTRNWSSTTAIGSWPILQVPTG